MVFLDKIRKVALTIIQETPELLNTSTEERAKKQGQAIRNAERNMNKYERIVSRAAQSSKMNNPEYAKRINEAKIKLQNAKIQFKNNIDLESIGTLRLVSAADPNELKNSPGVYILRVNGRIMKVGSAEIGVQKRMQQYYGLNSYCGLNHITLENRDKVRVTWQHCPIDKCNELESKLFDKYGGVENMPWAVRRPHSTNDTILLRI